MTRYPVLQRRKEDSDWETVGIVHAPDREMALGYALHSFFRHGEGVHCAIDDDGEIVTVTDPADVIAHTDKSYRVSAGYPLGPKRRRAEARIAELGVRIDKIRPGSDNRRDRSREQHSDRSREQHSDRSRDQHSDRSRDQHSDRSRDQHSDRSGG